MEHLVSIVGLGLLCGAWVLVQRFFARHDPEAPGVEGRHGCRGAPRPDVRAVIGYGFSNTAGPGSRDRA